ncbi:hypothetical protein [uncultured Flavobacterium sp.]|uniref:hypothetical protein n=1 Tax=uncultured Flavobacterium sp. TaxID=165435 RepID=UPI0025FA2D2D|nr:hypothetical protein [uncultured Flavobacterium sp.]
MKNRIIAIAVIAALAIACNEKKETEKVNEQPAVQEVVDATGTDVDSVKPEKHEVADKSAQLAEGTDITVEGTIAEINQGKDGYTAKIKMADGTVYFAIISIPNLKDPKQYKKHNVGDIIKVKGKTFTIEEDTLIKVDELL